MSTRFHWLATIVICAAVAGACVGPIDESTELAQSTDRLELTDSVVSGTLAFLNDAGTTRTLLDDTCGFYSNAATQTVRHINGRDRVRGTEDDNPLDNWAEFQGIHDIGPAHEEKAVECAARLGWTSCPSDGEEMVLIEDYDLLPASLQVLVDTIVDEENARIEAILFSPEPWEYEWFSYNGPFRFRNTEIYYECGAESYYNIQIGRLLDDLGTVETINIIWDVTVGGEVDRWQDAG